MCECLHDKFRFDDSEFRRSIAYSWIFSTSLRQLDAYHLPVGSSHQRMKRYLNRRRSLSLDHLSHSGITPGQAEHLSIPDIPIPLPEESRQPLNNHVSILDSISQLPSELKSTNPLLIFKGDLDYKNLGCQCRAFLFSDVLILTTDVQPKPPSQRRGSLIPALRRRLSFNFLPKPSSA